mgnify:CR=1 FL=1
MFAEGTADNTCVISSELASYNDLAVGDTITLSNPNQEDETYTLTIAGIYETESTSDSASSMMGGFMAGADSSNQIYVSYQILETILTQSEENATTTTDSTTGETTTTALRSMLNGTYAFDSVSDYEKFQDEVKEMGLSDGYTVSSSDLTSYEESLEPLQHLSEYAGYFLMVILAIGAVILIVLHIFAIRERKYEIGVLAAIGMKKWKIAVQFLTESLCITFCALIIGAGIGAVSSVPVTITFWHSRLRVPLLLDKSSGLEEKQVRRVAQKRLNSLADRKKKQRHRRFQMQEVLDLHRQPIMSAAFLRQRICR